MHLEEEEEHLRERRSVHVHVDAHAVEGEVGQVLEQVAPTFLLSSAVGSLARLHCTSAL